MFSGGIDKDQWHKMGWIHRALSMILKKKQKIVSNNVF